MSFQAFPWQGVLSDVKIDHKKAAWKLPVAHSASESEDLAKVGAAGSPSSHLLRDDLGAARSTKHRKCNHLPTRCRVCAAFSG